jgi:hypothetical protein
MSPILQTFANGSAYGYRTLAGAVAGDYDSIATVIVGAGSPSVVSITSIPQTYTHLQARIIVQGTTAFNVPFLGLGINGDTSNVYGTHRLVGDGTTVTAVGNASQSQMIFPRFPDTATPNYTNMFGAMIIDYLDYTGGNKNPTVRGYGGYDANGSGQISLNSGVRLNTAAITSVQFNSAGLAAGSSFALYGIKGN